MFIFKEFGEGLLVVFGIFQPYDRPEYIRSTCIIIRSERMRDISVSGHVDTDIAFDHNQIVNRFEAQPIAY